jgi:hypothetical protein
MSKVECNGDLTQAVKRRLLTTEPRVQFWVTLRVIREEGSGDGTRFRLNFLGFPLFKASRAIVSCWFLPWLTLQP